MPKILNTFTNLNITASRQMNLEFRIMPVMKETKLRFTKLQVKVSSVHACNLFDPPKKIILCLITLVEVEVVFIKLRKVSHKRNNRRYSSCGYTLYKFGYKLGLVIVPHIETS